MNRLIWTGVRELPLSKLPPARREGRLRVLFLSIHALGWSTFAEQLERYSARRDDIDACHIRLIPPLWMRLLNRRLPVVGGELAHPNTTWSWLTGQWLNGPLPLDRFDVIHVSPGTAALAAARLRAGRSFRLSCSIDCTAALWSREMLGRSSVQRRRMREERELYDRCDLVCPWSQWVAESLTHDYAVPPDRMRICRPVLDEAGVPRASPTRRRPADALVRLLFVGNDWKRKGGPQLLRWHQQHFASRAELHVVSAKAAPDPGARNVVWHGYVPHARLISEILPEMDVFVFPTQAEMLGIVLIEAATFGLPTVTSRIAALPELVEEGRTGFLCDPTDEAAFVRGIGRLIDDPQLREQMSIAARAHAATQFSPDAQYGPLIDRWAELAKGGASEPASIQPRV